MKDKKFAALLLAAVMAASLFACGDSGTAMQKIVDAYNNTNPEYQVEHIMVEQGNLYTQLPLVVNSQQGVPDLVIQRVDHLPSNAAGI